MKKITNLTITRNVNFIKAIFFIEDEPVSLMLTTESESGYLNIGEKKYEILDGGKVRRDGKTATEEFEFVFDQSEIKLENTLIVHVSLLWSHPEKDVVLQKIEALLVALHEVGI
ncbi:hypothetical protein WKH16_03575 [Pantoea agglomerans]|jgi:hypothetical protein|uniref:hypothetical protein n=1 Tax=Enterobacter agglomerans TaxID=549 RepID=UPI003C7BB419